MNSSTIGKRACDVQPHFNLFYFSLLTVDFVRNINKLSSGHNQPLSCVQTLYEENKFDVMWSMATVGDSHLAGGGKHLIPGTACMEGQLMTPLEATVVSTLSANIRKVTALKELSNCGHCELKGSWKVWNIVGFGEKWIHSIFYPHVHIVQFWICIIQPTCIHSF